MTVRRVVEIKAYNGRRVFKRGVSPKMMVIASGLLLIQQKDITYSVATTGCYIAVNTAGTGTKFNV
jgi:hypothetical protein